VGFLRWSAACLDDGGTVRISEYSDNTAFRFVSVGGPGLTEPPDFSTVQPGDGTVFRWIYDGPAQYFIFGVVQVDAGGFPIGEVALAELSAGVRSLDPGPEAWMAVPPGSYIWAVVPVIDEQYGPFMAAHFSVAGN
jgi:hypothetical protein